jgi:hypothetical protein
MVHGLAGQGANGFFFPQTPFDVRGADRQPAVCLVKPFERGRKKDAVFAAPKVRLFDQIYGFF